MPAVTARLIAVAGVVSFAAGISYLFVSPSELPNATLAAMGALGALAFGAAARWLRREPVARTASRVVAGLGVAFGVASVLGITGSRVAATNRLEPTQVATALHVLGLVVSVALVVTAARSLRSVHAR